MLLIVILALAVLFKIFNKQNREVSNMYDQTNLLRQEEIRIQKEILDEIKQLKQIIENNK